MNAGLLWSGTSILPFLPGLMLPCILPYLYLGFSKDSKIIRQSIYDMTLARESFIKKHYPKEPFTYLWFIGVIPERQRNGFGSEVLRYVLDYSKSLNRPVYLETSTESNLPWYQKHGLEIYTVSDRFGFPFYFLKTA